MTTFEITGSYSIPEWWDVTLDAETEEEAKEEALRSIGMSYPEAVDIDILEVKKING